jgi:hypothetical protein
LNFRAPAERQRRRGAASLRNNDGGREAAHNCIHRGINVTHSFRPATLAVALSLAFAAELSIAADAAPAAANVAAAAPATSGLDKSGMDTGVRGQPVLGHERRLAEEHADPR